MFLLKLLCITAFLEISFASDYGIWQINFERGIAWKDISGNFCDGMGECDAYLKISIIDEEVHKTRTHWGQRLPYFADTYISPVIRKDAKITIEMIDEDYNLEQVVDLGTPDDLMSRWTDCTPISFMRHDTLMGDRWDGIYQNKLQYSSSWTEVR